MSIAAPSKISIFAGSPSSDRSWKGWIKPTGEFVHCNGKWHKDLVLMKFAPSDSRIELGPEARKLEEQEIRLAAVRVGYVRVIARQGGGLVFEGLADSLRRRGVKRTIERLIENAIEEVPSVTITSVDANGRRSGEKAVRFKGFDPVKRMGQALDSGILENSKLAKDMTRTQKLLELATLNETSLSRIWQHAEQRDAPYALISAHRNQYDENENRARSRKMGNMIRSMGYGYIHMNGHYIEDGNIPVEEDSLFVVGKEDEPHETFFDRMTYLAKTFDQETVLIGNRIDGAALYSGSGKRERGLGRFSPQKIGFYYSQLRGSSRTFVFESFTPPSFSTGLEALRWSQKTGHSLTAPNR